MDIELLIGRLVHSSGDPGTQYGIIVDPEEIGHRSVSLSSDDQLAWAIWTPSIAEAVDAYEQAFEGDLRPVSEGGKLQWGLVNQCELIENSR
jgi:hypothetical protein